MSCYIHFPYLIATRIICYSYIYILNGFGSFIVWYGAIASCKYLYFRYLVVPILGLPCLMYSVTVIFML
jgi:hypothetical protein